jgi:hypothetical protein
MTNGTPVNRHWVVILQNGNPVIDWGNNLFQDLLNGQFSYGTEADVSHTIQDDELELLKHMSRIYHYDAKYVYIHPLPEPPRRTID